jgi:hypothetical protein
MAMLAAGRDGIEESSRGQEAKQTAPTARTAIGQVQPGPKVSLGQSASNARTVAKGAM